MIVNAFIIFQEFKKENPLMFDNLPVHFGRQVKNKDSHYNFHNGTMFYNVFLVAHLA
jgi:hypothetical protein